MTPYIEQRGETSRLQALLEELTPPVCPPRIEARCETTSCEDWLELIRLAKEKTDGC